MPGLWGHYGAPPRPEDEWEAPVAEDAYTGRRRRRRRSLGRSLGSPSPVARRWARRGVVGSLLNQGYAGYDGEQGQVINTILARSERQGVGEQEQLAALETGLTEANLRNPNYGDRDSIGFRQERVGHGTVQSDALARGHSVNAERLNVDAAATRLFSEMQSVGNRDLLTPGQLAQTVQRSAYPDRYDQRQGEASSLLAEWDRRTKGGLDKAIAATDVVPKGAAKATPAALKDFTGNTFVGGGRARFTGALGSKLQKLAKLSGQPVHVTSGFRTYEEQERLYQMWLNGTGNLAAKPGSSNHEFGAAADLELTGEQRKIATEIGLGFPVSGEDWHVELTGGPTGRPSAGGGPGGGWSPSTEGSLTTSPEKKRRLGRLRRLSTGSGIDEYRAELEEERMLQEAELLARLAPEPDYERA